jgi:hypothetical protein
MAKKTLLQMTQDILNDLDSDEANSINDTVEATQVAQIIRTCYEEMMSNRNWPMQKKIIQLEASGNLNHPNYLTFPEGIKELVSFKYNVIKDGETRVQYKDVKWLYPDEFLKKIDARNSDNTNIQQVQDDSGIILLIQNDKAPEWWTTFDDAWIICDSYDVAVDDTLKKSKTQAIVYKETTWTHTDSFIPDMPEEAFSALIEEAKSTAFIVLKQMANQKAEQKATRQQRWLSRKAWKAHGGVRYPDYGRK